MSRALFTSPSSLGLVTLTLLAAGACSASREGTGTESQPVEGANANASPPVRTQPNVPTGIDTSHSTVQTGPHVSFSRAESSPELRSLPSRVEADEEDEAEEAHPVGKISRMRAQSFTLRRDGVLQDAVPLATMPATIVNFQAQGVTKDATTLGGTPGDTNGAVGPNHFVQAVNTAVAIWDKSGNVVEASKSMVGLWANYVGTNAGNACATNDSGDPVVVYDQLADRWFITQFSLPNVNSGPNYQCVAVSKTADPAGAYWLYDFEYAGLNDYGKFGIWPDAYYATFNMFNSDNGDADFCAYDRVSMLSGATATEQCFQQGNSVSGALPVSLDSKITPPRGTPGFFMQLSDTSSLDLFKLKVDWKTPSNSKLTGPTNIAVTSYSPMCGNSGTCVPQPSPGNQLDSLSDRMMFRLTYRNFGTHDALMVNHSVDSGSGGSANGGVRWYEIRSPNGTPSVYQQGTYAPADGNWRWMASLAQDQAQDFVLGFSISSTTKHPSIGWTGRFPSDTLGTMAQGESVIDNGTGVETGTFSDGSTASRWGDYSNLTLDPTDDCTYWYTTELYNQVGPTPRTYDTNVASVKFPRCAANDFSPALAPLAKAVAPGASTTFTVNLSPTKGTAESIALAVQDLPTGVTGSFSPATVTAGTPSTLTLTAAANAPLTTSAVTFMVIGSAPSATHAATAQLDVGTVTTGDAGSGDSGTGDSGIIGTGDSGTGDDSGTTGDDSGVVTGDDSGATGDDSGLVTGDDSGSTGGFDSGAGADSGTATDGGTTGGGTGDSSGCGCRTAGSSSAPSERVSLIAGLALLGVVARRRRSRR